MKRNSSERSELRELTGGASQQTSVHELTLEL